MNRFVIMLGAGGYAKVLFDALCLQNVPVFGVADCRKTCENIIDKVSWTGTDEDVFKLSPDSIMLVNAIGSVRSLDLRKKIFDKFKRNGFSFQQVIHPSAVIANDVALGEGVQVMAGAIIQTGSQVGDNTIVNTKASIDHDCIVGKHVHVAPGVTLSGGVIIGEGAHIGTGATIIQGIRIAEYSVVGAGAVVIRDVPANTTVAGVPARLF